MKLLAEFIVGRHISDDLAAMLLQLGAPQNILQSFL